MAPNPRVFSIIALVGLLASSWTLAAAEASTSTFTLIVESEDRLNGITSDADGVWVRTDAGVASVTAQGLGLVVPVAYGHGVLRDGDGAFYVSTVDGLRKVTSTSNEPVSGQGSPRVFLAYGFGADGRMLAVHDVRASAGYEKIHLAPDRSRSVIPSMPYECAIVGDAVGPDGNLYAVSFNKIYRCSVTTGVSTLVANVTVAQGSEGLNGVAFGDDGAFYVTEMLSGGGGRILRFDAATGAQAVVASFPFRGRDPTFHGEALHVLTYRVAGGRLYHGVGSVDVGTTGFQGFHPSFDLPPSADLAITRTWVERAPIAVGGVSVDNDVNEQRRVFVEIANIGAADVTVEFQVVMGSGGNGNVLQAPLGTGTTTIHGAWSEVRTVSGLVAGGDVVVEFPWNTTLRAGNHQLWISVDGGNLVPELIERDNNRATVDQTVRVEDIPLA